jgi:hypothetical protein
MKLDFFCMFSRYFYFVLRLYYMYILCPRDMWCGESLLQYMEKMIFLYFMIRYSFPWIINSSGFSPLRPALFLCSSSLFCCALYVNMYKIYNCDQLHVFRVFLFTREHKELGRKDEPTTIHQRWQAAEGQVGGEHQEACKKVTVSGAYCSSDNYHKNLSLRPWSKLGKCSLNMLVCVLSVMCGWE